MVDSFPSAFSRRHLLAGAAAVGGVLIAGSAFAQSTAPAPATALERKLGFAIVGIGSLSMNQILPGFAKAKYCYPAALVSGHPDKASQQAAKYNIDPKNIYTYDNFDSIKDNPAIDVVYIVLPNGMHAEYTIRAAKAGKHVLCEKPMANTVEECQAMIDACKVANRKLQIGYRMRYEPMTQKAIALAQSPDTLGTIKQITAQCGFSIGDPKQWRCNKKLAGGGSMRDIGIYALSAVRYLSGQEPTEVLAMEYTTPGDPRFKDIEETLSFDLRFDSGLVASVLSSYGFSCNQFNVYGTKGQLEATPFQSYTANRLYQIKNRQREEIPYTPVDHFATEMDALCTAITADKPIIASGEEGLRDMKIMMAAYESAASGKAVKIT